MIEKTINLLRYNNINIPRTLLLNYKNINLSEKELIVLIYLLNEENNSFNPKKISDDLKYTLPEVLEIIEKLNTLDILSINLNKNNGVIEEQVDLLNLYKKLAYLIVNENEVKEEVSNENIYDNFEREFGRTLSPIEYEYINGWLNDDFNEEIINCALKEAVFNGATNLRYIDAILYEWKKKGIKSKDDVEKNKESFKKKASKKTEMFECDWLNDEQ